jgi:hypothetical protein
MAKHDNPVPPDFNDDMKQTREDVWSERPPLSGGFVVRDTAEECYKEYNKRWLQNKKREAHIFCMAQI